MKKGGISMESKENVMKKIFSELNEQNQEMMILIAKGVNIAQENSTKKRNSLSNKKNIHEREEVVV